MSATVHRLRDFRRAKAPRRGPALSPDALRLSRAAYRYRWARFEASLTIGVCVIHGTLCAGLALFLVAVAIDAGSALFAAGAGVLLAGAAYLTRMAYAELGRYREIDLKYRNGACRF